MKTLIVSNLSVFTLPLIIFFRILNFKILFISIEKYFISKTSSENRVKLFQNIPVLGRCKNLNSNYKEYIKTKNKYDLKILKFLFKNNNISVIHFKYYIPNVGLEPTTTRLRAVRSTTELYRLSGAPRLQTYSVDQSNYFDTGRGARTLDRTIPFAVRSTY